MHTEVRFASFLSGGFTTMAVINLSDWKLANRTSLQWSKLYLKLNAKPEIQILSGLYVLNAKDSDSAYF